MKRTIYSDCLSQIEKKGFVHIIRANGKREQRRRLSHRGGTDNPFYERSELYLIFKACWK